MPRKPTQNWAILREQWLENMDKYNNSLKDYCTQNSLEYPACQKAFKRMQDIKALNHEKDKPCNRHTMQRTNDKKASKVSKK